MKIIGLTGGSGAGKSSVAQYLEQRYDFAHIDGDKIARHVTDTNRDCLNELTDYFGGDIIDAATGRLNRSALAAKAFAGEEQTAALNRITHKFITREINAMIARFEAAGAPAVTVDGAAIIESGTANDCDALIVVTAPYSRRLAMIMVRDGISEEQAKQRLHAQKPDSWYAAHADYVIENSGTLEQLHARLDDVAARIMAEEK